MKIITHTKYGVFHSKETEYTKEAYDGLTNLLEQIASLSYFSFHTDDGFEIYMTKEMIADSLFFLQK